MARKRSTRGDVRAVQRRVDRRALAELREDLRIAKARRGAARKAQTERCRAARRRLTKRIRRKRDALRAELNAEAKAARAIVRERCQARQARIKASGATAVAKARAKVAEQKNLRRLVATVDSRNARKRERVSRTTYRREADDEVRQNIPDDLIPVFNKVRRYIKGGPRKTRSEHFYQYVEENPGEVATIQGEIAELETARLIREIQKAERKAHREAEKRRHAAVPF